MGKKCKRQKLIDALAAFGCGCEATCPKCGRKNFNIGFIELDEQKHTGFGAFWCEDCRIALMLCRANLTDEAMRQNIVVAALPDDLKYI